MGVIPNGPDGVNATGWPGMLSAAGHSATSAADLRSLDQPTVQELFKEKFIGAAGSGVSVFTSATGPLAEVFKGLPAIPGASLPLLIIASIAGRLLGVDPATLVGGGTNGEQVAAAIAALEKVPVLGELVEILTGVEDGDLTDVGTWVNNLANKLIHLDITGLFDAAGLTNIANITAVPPDRVIGIGFETIADTIGQTWNQLWGGLAQLTGADKGIADVANQATQTAITGSTALQLGEWNNAILMLRNNKSLMSGMDETSESNFSLEALLDGNTNPPIISATASSVPMAFWRATEFARKGFISWLGRGITNITALYVDLYKFNYATSTMELFHSSVDQIGSATGSWSTLIYYLPSLDRFDVNGGDVIGVAWRVTGTGTHEIAGRVAPWLPDDASVVPKRPAATRTGSGDLAFGSITYSGNIPWFGIGIAAGDVPPPYFAPRTTEYATPGTYTYAVPDWATIVDGVYLGAGAGANGGSTFSGQVGNGGAAGVWATEKLVRGVDFPDVPGATIDITVGTGGAWGPAAGVGGDGGATVRAAISGGKAAVTAAGGVAAPGGGSPTGQSPGDKDFEGAHYIGGAATASTGGNGADGQAPGSGGAGGQGGIYGIAWAGGAGARGGAWFRARQS